MAMNTTPRSDGQVTRRYRDASDALGEAPSAATRAAILAAAARQVQARPEDALNMAKRPTRAFARWPLGAAAAVLLSTLAVLMADRTGREIESELASSRTDSALEARADSAKPASSAPATAAEQYLKAKQDNAIDAVAQPPAALREKAPEVESRRASPPAAAPPARQEIPASPPAPARTVGPAQAPPAAAIPPASDAAAAKSVVEPAAREQDRGLSTSAPAAPSAIGQLRKNERERAATPLPSAESPAAAAPAVAGAAARAEAKVETSAAAWLERIIELRRKGENEQADAELRKFRERYPEVVIPPQAQPAIGTR